MKTILVLTIIVFNIFSVFISIRMLKGYEKSKIFMTVCVGELVLFALCNIIYAITSGGITPEVHKASKWYIVLTMLPINVLVMFCPIVNEINKKSFNETTDDKFAKKIFLYVVISIVLLVAETIYIKNVQLGIANFAK